MSYTLSTDQAEALRRIGGWYKAKQSPFLTLGGYAGTGKTTLIAYLRKALREYDGDAKVAFCAFTGKAARVLDARLREQKVPRRGDTVSTIHSLIYMAETNEAGHVVGWQRKDKLDVSLIIVDEASMVDETIWRDLLSFGVPILAVGDHGQLPPVGSPFSLMADPQIKLERIWRQEAGSPIIQVATLARQDGYIPVGEYGQGVRKLSQQDPETGLVVQEILESANADRLVLCGYNKTRQKLNQAMRSFRDMETAEPASGDRVVCLRNNRAEKLYNGMTGVINHLAAASGDEDAQWYQASIKLDDEDRLYEGYVLRRQFGATETVKDMPMSPDGSPGDLFDFGYALTVHKAQGSQAEEVLVFEERFPRSSDDEWRRWLYTAVTRATTRLTVVGD